MLNTSGQTNLDAGIRNSEIPEFEVEGKDLKLG